LQIAWTVSVSGATASRMASPHAGENAGMDEQVLQLAEQLLATGFLKLSERERRVITGVAKRTQISRDVNRPAVDPTRSGEQQCRVTWKAQLHDD
jgi:hypothetical protein